MPGHVLFSAHPVSAAAREGLQAAYGVDFAERHSLTEIKGLSWLGLLRTLRGIHAETLWVPAARHDPLASLLLLLGSLTRARRLMVIDPGGRGEAIAWSRFRVWSRETTRLATGTGRGLLRLRRAAGEARALLSSARVEARIPPDRPRIAFLRTNLWYGIEAGGSVGHVAGVVNAFSRMGCPVDVLAVERPPMLDAAVNAVQLAAPGAVTLMPELGNHAFHEDVVGQAQAVLDLNRPDLIYYRNSLGNYAGVLLSRRFGVPLVLEYNGSETWVSQAWGVRLLFPEVARSIEAANLRHAHLIVVVSRVLEEELIARGVPPTRILCHPNCVDPALFDPGRFDADAVARIRARNGASPENVVCLFLGTFGPWHGAEVFAQAIRRIVTGRPEGPGQGSLHFWLVGDGQRMPQVRKILDEVAPERYRLMGLVPQAEAPLFLAAADLVVSPHVGNPDGSRFFGSPTKLFEYMAMGRAVVASELEQIGEVLAGSRHVGRDGPPRSADDVSSSRALLVTPGSVEELAAAIEALAAQPDTRVRLGRAAREEALARYTWPRFAAAVLDAVRAIEPAGRE